MKFFYDEGIPESVDVEAILKGLNIAIEEDIDFLFKIGDLFVQKKRFTSARWIYHKITKLRPDSSIAWFKEGNVLDEIERFDDAIFCFDKAIEINRNFFEAYSNKGITLAKMKNYEDALRCYNKATRLNENNPLVLYNKGKVFSELCKNSEAIKFFERAIELSDIRSEVYLESLLSMGFVLSRIGKYDEAIDSNDRALKIYPTNWRLWTNQGIAFGKLKRYKEEIRCYNRALRVDKNLLAPLYNKGIALTNLGKLYKTTSLRKSHKYFNVAYKFLDRALELNPISTSVQLSMGVILGELDRFDDALECCNKVISKNENFPEAYGNKGILFLNAHKYVEAERELQVASELFLKMDRKKDAKIASDYASLAVNANDLICQMKPIDEQFLSCLNSQSLAKLKEDISYISKRMTEVTSDFIERKLPGDAKKLLFCKEVCINTLLNAINFQEIDFKRLDESKLVFEKWDLYDYIIAVNSLDSFIRYSHKVYKKFDGIPSEEEPVVLSLLRNIYVLDGNLTKDISDKFKGESYVPRPIELNGPKIIEIPIPYDIKNKFIKIGLVQLKYTLTKTYPYKLEKKEIVKSKILSALKIADSEDIDILCFPELCFSEEFIEEARKYKNRIIIGGSFYRDNFNICPVLMGGEEYDVLKINPSPYYETELISGKGMKSGNDIKIFFSTKREFKFAVLVCWDYIKESNRLYLSGNGEKPINLIINPQYNSDKDRFQRKADTDCENYHADIIQVNAYEFGGSCIFGIENKNVIDRLKSAGCRQEDGFVYKLCEASGEMMIFSDLDLAGIEVPSSVDSKPRIRITGCYIYEKDSWQKKESPWWIES
jgi:tetratricopeptide (TPR) repeat protein/predicted amidohydrolase